MLKPTLAALTAVLTMLGANMAAHADASKPFAIQLGIADQLSGGARQTLNYTGLHAGAEVDINDATNLFVLPGTQSIDFDYNHISGHGSRLDLYGVTYANRIELIPKDVQPAVDHLVPYVGFGLGFFQNDLRVKSTAADVTTYDNNSRLTFGGKLMAGVNTSTGIFIEATYMVLSGEVGGLRTDNVDLSLGTRF